MKKIPSLSQLLFALTWTSLPLLAQPNNTDLTPAQQESAPVASEPVLSTPANDASKQKKSAPEPQQTSPFEYRPSEKISEDAAVSFPIDI